MKRMFSFHKPKVYRSSTGCCICKAKSSSSRFTDSKKYEEDFVQCFQLSEKRCGEVCNACVLLVKRWKKLPQGNSRNWRHVVDARAGPGTKSMTKFKLKSSNSRSKEKRKLHDDDFDESSDGKKFKREQSPVSDELPGDDGSEGSPEGSRSPSPSVEDREDDTLRKRYSQLPVSSFVDLSIWKREEICCGTVFVGPQGVLIVDPRYIKPCNVWQGCFLKSSAPIPVAQSTSASGKYSDSSSDSGYDESSNPSPIVRTAIPAN